MRPLIAAVLLVLLGTQAEAIECRSSKGSGGHWSWRNIDGQRCWYRGARGMSKRRLTWGESNERKLLLVPPMPKPRPSDRLVHDGANRWSSVNGYSARDLFLRSQDLFSRQTTYWIEQDVYASTEFMNEIDALLNEGREVRAPVTKSDRLDLPIRLVMADAKTLGRAPDHRQWVRVVALVMFLAAIIFTAVQMTMILKRRPRP